MIRSMTGFARCELPYPQGILSWEIKTLNHRFLDIQTRLPEALRAAEMTFRDVIRQHVGRGRVEAVLKLQHTIDEKSHLQCDEARLKALLSAIGRIETLSSFSHGAPSLDALLAYPGIVTEIEVDMTALEPVAITALSQCLVLLNQSRQREGQALSEAITERLEKMEILAKAAHARQPELLEAQERKLLEKLQALSVQADPHRLEQELVFWAQKMDNGEEIDRLLTHVTEIRRILQEKGSVGKTLDFMMQELNREANTLGSKSLDAETSKASVDLKVLIEQMREQVQNIE